MAEKKTVEQRKQDLMDAAKAKREAFKDAGYVACLVDIGCATADVKDQVEDRRLDTVIERKLTVRERTFDAVQAKVDAAPTAEAKNAILAKLNPAELKRQEKAAKDAAKALAESELDTLKAENEALQAKVAALTAAAPCTDTPTAAPVEGNGKGKNKNKGAHAAS